MPCGAPLPGVGGHAVKEHGNARANVTSRGKGKGKDGAFNRGWAWCSITALVPLTDRAAKAIRNANL